MSSLSLLNIGAYVLIGVGAFSILSGFCGLLGAAKETKCLLGLVRKNCTTNCPFLSITNTCYALQFAVLLSLVVLAEIAIAILVIIVRARIETETVKYITSTLNKHYVGLPESIHTKDLTNKAVTMAWDKIQIQVSALKESIILNKAIFFFGW